MRIHYWKMQFWRNLFKKEASNIENPQREYRGLWCHKNSARGRRRKYRAVKTGIDWKSLREAVWLSPREREGLAARTETPLLWSQSIFCWVIEHPTRKEIRNQTAFSRAWNGRRHHSLLHLEEAFEIKLCTYSQIKTWKAYSVFVWEMWRRECVRGVTHLSGAG